MEQTSSFFQKYLIAPFKQGKKLNAIFLANIFLSFHYYLIIYINSSFLGNFFSESQISALYVIGAVLNILLFLNISKFLEKVGNFKTTIYAIILEGISIAGLIISSNPLMIGLYFIIEEVMIMLLLFNLDLFLENLSNDEEKIGQIRGMYLTLSNITIVISTLIITFVLSGNSYIKIYSLSLIFLAPLFWYINKYFKNFVDKPQKHIQIKTTVLEYIKNINLRSIFAVYFLLQIFYAFMVVYMPIYLNKYIGFSWSEIGLIFTIMLLPFVLFEIPVGDLADKKYGEKEFLTIGLIIIGISTLFISFVTVKIVWIWAIILFITRVGASIVEISSDTYFFKKVRDDEEDIISFYRIARPLSFVITPLITTTILQFIPFEYTFMIIGVLMIMGIHSSLLLKDTK